MDMSFMVFGAFSIVTVSCMVFPAFLRVDRTRVFSFQKPFRSQEHPFR